MKKLLFFLVLLSAFSLLFGQDVPTDGLVAYYTFDNDVDTTVTDASGNEAHGPGMISLGNPRIRFIIAGVEL